MISHRGKENFVKPKFCMFGFSKDIDMISAAGFESIEMHMHEILSMGKTEFSDLCQKLDHSGLTCEVINNPIPLDQVIADENFDLQFHKEQIKIGVERASILKTRYINFGNGKTRSLPLSGDLEVAEEKNLQFMQMLVDIASEKGITILIEPLAPQVSNVVLSIPEAIDYALKIERPNLGTFLDYRWFVALNHPFTMIDKYAGHIKHVHIDNPDSPFPTRLIPRLDDGHDYSELFRALKRINYDKAISIEANTFKNYSKDLQEGLHFLETMSEE